jgi:hypothetical protein
MWNEDEKEACNYKILTSEIKESTSKYMKIFGCRNWNRLPVYPFLYPSGTPFCSYPKIRALKMAFAIITNVMLNVE